MWPPPSLWAAKTVRSSCGFFFPPPWTAKSVRSSGDFCSSPWAAKADRGSGDCLFFAPWAAKTVRSSCGFLFFRPLGRQNRVHVTVFFLASPFPLGRQNRAKFMCVFVRSSGGFFARRPGPPKPCGVHVISFFCSPPLGPPKPCEVLMTLLLVARGRQNRAKFR